jgi:hypothetical protein
VNGDASAGRDPNCARHLSPLMVAEMTLAKSDRVATPVLVETRKFFQSALSSRAKPPRY